MENPVRSVLAVAVGYLAMGLFTALIILASASLLEGPPTGAYALTNLAISVFGAVLGGFVAGRLATSRPLGHGIALGLLAFAIGAGYQVARLLAKLDAQPGPEPTWYLLALPAIALLGCPVGGWLEQRRRAGGDGGG
jgi:peptidoglycan/LPS O-acetylase OafA/YrhL